MTEILFIMFSLISVVSAFLMVFDKNPIHSILFLALVFLAVSGLFILMNVEFIAMLFLVVYLGALIVLFLFVVMMLNIKILELKERFVKYIPLGGLVGIIFLIEVVYILSSTLTSKKLNDTFNFSDNILNTLNLINSDFNKKDEFNYLIYSNVKYYTNIEYLGQILYTEYVYFFILASMILLVAMIGSIILTLNQELINKRQDIYIQIDRVVMTAIARKKLI